MTAAFERVSVVGTSLAGLRAVEALRRRGYAGSIVWVGKESNAPYDRPPLSKQILRGEWEPERTALKPGPETLGVDLRLGRAAVSLDAVNRTVVLDDGDRVPYEALVIATGASPRTLPGRLPSGVHTLRTLDDALAIRGALAARPRVAVVGAGFIGLEVAASCRMLGIDVTIVEAAPVPLSALGPEMGQGILNLHRERGAVVHTGVSVREVRGDARVSELALSDGTTVPADLVVIGIGVVPETAWLEGSGVRLDDGVVCDAHGATGLPGVVACGDVARWHNPLFDESMRVEHWTNAVEQAHAAVAWLLDPGGAPAWASVPYFWSDQYDAKIQFAGRVAASDAMRVVEGSIQERNLVALYGRAGRTRGVLAVNQPAALVRYRRAVAEGAPFG